MAHIHHDGHDTIAGMRFVGAGDISAVQQQTFDLSGNEAAQGNCVGLLFDYCIANFDLGFCDIPLLFRVNKSGRDTPRPDRYIVLLTGIIEYRLRWHLTELIFQKH